MPGPSEIGQGTPRCGAKTRSGGTCKNAAMANGRCRMHGGSTRNVPKGKDSPHYTHGIYSKALTDDEQEIWEGLDTTNLEEEIRLQKIIVRRAAKAVLEQERYPKSFQVGFEADERERGVKGGEVVNVMKSKRPDVRAILDRALARLTTLVTRQAEITGDRPEDATAFARSIQAHLDEIEDATVAESS